MSKSVQNAESAIAHKWYENKDFFSFVCEMRTQEEMRPT